MRTSASDDTNFINEVISSNLLENAIDFIVNRYSAEELYGKEVLEEWAYENGFISSEREQILMNKISDLEEENITLQNELNNLEN